MEINDENVHLWEGYIQLDSGDEVKVNIEDYNEWLDSLPPKDIEDYFTFDFNTD